MIFWCSARARLTFFTKVEYAWGKWYFGNTIFKGITKKYTSYNMG